MYRWLLLPVLQASPEELEAGLTYGDIRRMISANHPKKTVTANKPEGEINPGNVTQALQSTASLQVGKMRIRPIILDYDESRRRLNVVDRGFLIWLGHQDRAELLATVGLPSEPTHQVRLER